MSWQAVLRLDDQLGAFVEGQISQGRYDDPVDVVSAALRLLQDQEIEVERIRQALDEGENSGIPEPFDFDAFVARKRGPA